MSLVKNRVFDSLVVLQLYCLLTAVSADVIVGYIKIMN